MGRIRAITVVAVLGLIAAAPGARAAVNGTVNGGGFVRDGSTRTQLSVSGVDDSDEDSGRANYLVKESKSKPAHQNLSLDCLYVSGNRAYASGVNRDDDRFYLVVEDNGEPGRGNDEFGIDGDSIERFAFFLIGFKCGAIDIFTSPIGGGNYQVREAD
jgi:hypothetical protein